MSLLVFGERGQVGIDMQRQMGPDAPFLLLGRDRADLANPDACADLIAKARPAVVINVAAVRDETLAAKDEDYAMLVNGTAPGRSARNFAHVLGGFRPWRQLFDVATETGSAGNPD